MDFIHAEVQVDRLGEPTGWTIVQDPHVEGCWLVVTGYVTMILYIADHPMAPDFEEVTVIHRLTKKGLAMRRRASLVTFAVAGLLVVASPEVTAVSVGSSLI